MSRRARFLASALCALLVVLACVVYAAHVHEEADRARTEMLKRYGGDTVSLVVTKRQVEAGEVLSSQDVDTCDWLASLAPEGAILSLDECVGRAVSVPAAANVPLCDLNFRDDSTLAEIPSGHVAVSVPITEKLGVTASVEPGSHVVAYRAQEGTAQLVGGTAVVLSVPGKTGSSVGKGMLTIAVTPQDVPAILAASTTGDLRLVVPADDVREFAGGTDQTKNVPAVPKEKVQSSQSDEESAHTDASGEGA